MDIKEISVQFTDTAGDEVNTFMSEIQLIPIVQYLQQTDTPLPTELKWAITRILQVVTDLFSTDLPEIGDDPEVAMRTISRDINLSRLLRERGIFRLYRLARQRTEEGVPLYMCLVNPNTNSPFSTQEEFVGWFCESAKVARSLAFMRIATIDRLQTVGFSLEEAFSMIITKPYAIRETLNMVASWEKGDMLRVEPDVVHQLAEKVSPGSSDALEPLIQAAKLDPENDELQDDLQAAAKPIIASLLSTVADHERAKDALNWVKHDILGRPEISYTWDEESSALMVVLIRKTIDNETGEEYMLPPVTVPFVADTIDLPVEIRTDLLRRLSIRNKAMPVVD